jgi:hypothetical protein
MFFRGGGVVLDRVTHALLCVVDRGQVINAPDLGTWIWVEKGAPVAPQQKAYENNFRRSANLPSSAAPCPTFEFPFVSYSVHQPTKSV